MALNPFSSSSNTGARSATPVRAEAVGGGMAQSLREGLRRIVGMLQSLRQSLAQGLFNIFRPRQIGNLQARVPAPGELPAQVPSALRQRADSAAGADAVAQQRRRDEAEAAARQSFDHQLEVICQSGLPLADKLTQLNALEDGIKDNAALGAGGRVLCASHLAERRREMEPGQARLKESLAGIQALKDLKWEGLPEVLAGRRGQLEALEKTVAACRLLGDPARQALATEVQGAHSRLHMLSTRDASQAALGVEAAGLASALGGLGPGAYVQARGSLDLILSRLSSTPRTLLLPHLDGLINRPGDVGLLDHLAAGDSDVIDSVFIGPEWADDALALKMAVIPPGDEAARLNVDAQHNLRMVSDELNAFMAARNVQDPGKRLPVSLFKAVQADPTVVDWLIEHASEEVGERGAQIAAWIRLSRGKARPDKADEAEINSLLARLQEKGIDTHLLGDQVRAGFRNTAEVVECRELMQSLVRACQESSLLKSLDEKRSAPLKATRVVCELFREVTGWKTEVATGAEVDEALANAVTNRMPWLQNTGAYRAARSRLAKDLSSLYGSSGGRARQERRWLADKAEVLAAIPDLKLAREVLRNDRDARKLRALGGEDALAKATREQQARELEDQVDQGLRQLAGFSPTHLRRPDNSRRAVTLDDLKRISDDLDKAFVLPSRYQEVARCEAACTPQTKEEQEQAARMLENLRRIAVLQVGIMSGNEHFAPNATFGKGETYTAQVIKRMMAFGLSGFSSAEANTPFLSQAAARMASATQTEKDGLAKLAEKFKPSGSVSEKVAEMAAQAKAQGNRLMKLFGVSTPAAESAVQARAQVTESPQATAKPVITLTEGQRRQAEALASVERQVRELSLGEAFDIRMGMYGTVSVGSPIVPGLSTSTDVRVEHQQGLRVHLKEDGQFVVRVQKGGMVRHGVNLAALSELFNLRGESEVGREKGFDLTVGSRESCLAMVRSLVTGGEVDPVALGLLKLEKVQQRSVEGRASVSVTADLTLGSLSAEAAAMVGSLSTFRNTVFGQVETQVRKAGAGVSASAELARGRTSVETSAGLNLSASKTLVREFGMLRPESELTLSAAVIGGNVDRSLSALFPGDAALSEAQRQAIKDALPRADGQVADGLELSLRYQITSAAMREANALLGQASRALTRAALASGQERSEAQAAARGFVREANELTRRTDSYALAGWGWSRREQVEVSRHRGVYQQFARGESSATQFQGVEGLGEAAGGIALSPSLAGLLP